MGKKFAAATRETISAKKLTELTGFTDRWIRQLAAEGLFPPPIRGNYEAEATIAGLFQHFQALVAKKTDTLRVEQEKLTRARRETAEEELRILRLEYVKTTEIGPALANYSLQQREILQRKLEGEIAPRLPGKSYAEIQAILAALVDEICKIFEEGTQVWTAEPPEIS
jgi:hypothetical protein